MQFGRAMIEFLRRSSHVSIPERGLPGKTDGVSSWGLGQGRSPGRRGAEFRVAALPGCNRKRERLVTMNDVG